MTTEQYEKAQRLVSLLKAVDAAEVELKTASEKFEQELERESCPPGGDVYHSEATALRFELLYPPDMVANFRRSVQLVHAGIMGRRARYQEEFANL